MMALCHELVESSVDVKYALGKGIKPDDIRIQPIEATDVDNNSYFFFSAFTVTDFIIYREVSSGDLEAGRPTGIPLGSFFG